MRFFTVGFVLAAASAGPLQARQGTGAAAPVIDTIIVITDNVFSQDEARANAAFRIANSIRVKTRRGVVRRELLFQVGDDYDPAKIAETERNLRSLGVFRDVLIDSLRVDGKFAVLVRTADGWSTQIALNASSTGNTFTWLAGLSELNFLGTATFVSASYRKDTDRSAVSLGTRINRLFNSRITVGGLYEDLSDGRRGGWLVGDPFRSFSDRRELVISNEWANQRVLQFRTPGDANQQVVFFQRRAFRNRIDGAIAPIAEPNRYLRIGASAQIKREEIFLQSDTILAIPDTVTGAVGVFGEYRRGNFKVVTHFNGFSQTEDLDLSTVVRVTTWLAPSAFGYDRTGVGPGLVVSTATSIPSGFMRLVAVANGLVTSSGLDSGRVAASFTVGTQLFARQATFLHLEAGMLKGPAPSREFDLGHGIGPRSFGPHAFTGDRSVWGTFEHRVFLVDDLFNLLGLGFATFVDYGGAWFDGDEPRFGGNVGFGLRTGATRATGANIGRIDVGYLFGDGRTGGRWVLSTGRGFPF